MNNKERVLQETLDALSLKAKGLSRKEISERLGISERQAKRRLASSSIGSGYEKTMAITGGRINVSEITGSQASRFLESDYFSGNDENTFPSKDERLYSHEEADRQRNELTEYFNQKYKGKTVKILNIADLHIPFTDYKTVTKVLKEHGDADILMINGDLLDLFSVSKYAKDQEVALKREIEEGRDFLEYVSKRFKDVVITDGNHERRLKHYVTNMIPSDMQFLFPQEILKVVVSGEVLKKKPLKNVHVVGSWWIKLFDVIFAHPDNYSAANLKTVQNTSEHFLLVKNIHHRMCIIGHTHRAGWLVAGEVKLMETGCLCFEMDYHNGSKFTRTKWVKAYSVVHIDKNGQSNLSTSTVHLV